MTKKEAVNFFGSQASLARSLGIYKTAVANWKGSVPNLRQYQIEVITKGKLKADLPTRKSAA